MSRRLRDVRMRDPFHDGRFFMVATFASSDPAAGPRGVQVLVSDEPTGPFVPWSQGPVTPRDIPCLDGTLFLDDDEAPGSSTAGVPKAHRVVAWNRRW